MTAKQVRGTLRRAGREEDRRSGSHLTVRCGDCQAAVPVHPGRDISPGVLRDIAKRLRPRIGQQEWMP
ncbi:MAG: type II toxin-antitoxin system HicA family toxin [Egibacteraceae bacterium]